MTSQIEKNKIVMKSKSNKEYYFDMKILSSISNFIENIIEDNDDLNIPMNYFTNEDLDILCKYYIY